MSIKLGRPFKHFIFWHFWVTQINLPGKSKGETGSVCVCVCVSKRECVYLRRPLCAPQTQPAEVRGPTNKQLTQERHCSGGNKKRVGTCESGGTAKVRMGSPSCCSSFTAAGTSGASIPPPSLGWSLVQAGPYGRQWLPSDGGGSRRWRRRSSRRCCRRVPGGDKKNQKTQRCWMIAVTVRVVGSVPGPAFTAAFIGNLIQNKRD